MKSSNIHTLRFKTPDGGKAVLRVTNWTDEEVVGLIQNCIETLDYTYLGEKAEPWYKRVPSSLWWWLGGSLNGLYFIPWVNGLIFNG